MLSLDCSMSNNHFLCKESCMAFLVDSFDCSIKMATRCELLLEVMVSHIPLIAGDRSVLFAPRMMEETVNVSDCLRSFARFVKMLLVGSVAL